MKIFIEHEFPNWNDYIKAERSNLYMANKMKQDAKKTVIYRVKERYTGEYPVTLMLRPHFKNKRKDLDNFWYKGLLDGLVTCGCLKNDNLTCIDQIVLEAVIDDKEGVEIEIMPSNRKVKCNIVSYLSDKTQTQLADEVKVYTSDIYGYVSGKRLPNVVTAIKIARALGVSVEEIWGGNLDEDEKNT